MACNPKAAGKNWRAAATLAVLCVLAVPLMAPTCGAGNPGTKAFSKHSLIIPMDACYQGDGTTAPVACPGSADVGNVLHAYGLVYQLLQHNVPVYWVIQPTKSTLTDEDLAITFNAGAPVGKLNRSGGTFAAPPPNNSTHTVRYRGGPFVVDGTDLALARDLIVSGLGTTYNDVNVHVSNVAFSAYAAKTMNGGWPTGGAIPPPIALLNITGADGKNAVATVQQYLVEAGLGGVSGAGGTAQGPHGTVYDTLTAADFCGANPALLANGYRVLWAPHWVAGSADPAGCTLREIRGNIARFVADGHDFFSECGSIGSVEGDVNACDGTANVTNAFDGGRIATTGGLRINKFGWDYQCNQYTDGGRIPGGTSRQYYPNFVPLAFSQFSSPFLQIAEFPFTVWSGAIADFAPAAGSAWQPTVQHLVTGTADWRGTFDVLSVKPGSELAGTVVYLGGHDYSGRDQPLQVAGARMVLNTLFNLGSSCVTTNSPCQTGQLGVCGDGRMQCVNGLLSCVQVSAPSAEVCDNKDNDCNGLVDDGLTASCYDGPAGTAGKAPCHAGTSTCSAGEWSACAGQVLPSTEVCNGVDDDCDGTADDGVAAQACYSGPVGSAGVGRCQAGTQPCVQGRFGACVGEVLPAPETCGNAVDDNCNGTAEEGCGCTSGDSQPCYGGPVGSAGVGPCHAGTQTCANGTWGECQGDQRPATETCNSVDDDCDGETDNHGACNVCTPGAQETCYTGNPATRDQGLCHGGTRACVGGQWDACVGEVLPSGELCDGQDNDCNGTPDDNDPLCPAGMACNRGVCVPSSCSAEADDCPEGFLCNGFNCDQVSCGAAPCPLGQKCHGGVCQDSCANVHCGPGAVCAGGRCTGGGCYASGCPDGGMCQRGSCVEDPCAGMTCPRGTFCRQGFCVQSCAYASCAEGQRCSQDGFCEDDACAGRTCDAEQACVEGTCQPDPCRVLSCGVGLTCQGGNCVDDPCRGVQCPASVCLAGQCYAGAPWLTDAGIPQDAGVTGWDAGRGLDAGTVSSSSSGGGDGAGEDGGSSSTCACVELPRVPPWGLGLWVGWALVVRRRRLACLAVLSTLLGCPGGGGESSSSNGGPPACVTDEDCGNGQVCRDSACAPAPDAGAQERDAGRSCETCGGSTCVDLFHDVQHCGTCDVACLEGEQCFLGGCGPVSPVAPWLDSLAPASGDVGASVGVQVTGERFNTGATLYVVAGLVAQELTATVADGQHLQATLDLRSAAPGPLFLRVLNPDRTLSNAREFTVTASTPHLDHLVPDHGLRGELVAVGVEGSGFNSTSQCKVHGTAFPEQGFPTAVQGATALSCALDLAVLQPGAFDVVVVNSGGLRSNTLTFTVDPGTPTLTSITPSAGRPGALLSMDVVGTRFDATSVVHFDGRALATTYLAPTHLFAAPLDLGGVEPGTHDVDVVNGDSLRSNALAFVVTSDAPHVTAVSPGSVLQGASATLDVQGRGFDGTSVVHVFSPGGQDVALTTSGSATQLTAPFTAANRVAGRWLVEVINAGGLASNAVPLDVLSSTAVMLALAPAGSAQGSTLEVRVEGSNFLAGATVHASRSGVPDLVLASRVDSPSVITLPALSLAGWDTGVTSFTVVNMDAQPSNGVSFTVTPGPPTLTSLTPTSAVMGQTVEVVLRGTNFAKPDADGMGGSVVHVAAPSAGVPDKALAATVVSATELRVAVDTTEGMAATYAVTVWNPGGAPPPQKSAALSFVVQP